MSLECFILWLWNLNVNSSKSVLFLKLYRNTSGICSNKWLTLCSINNILYTGNCIDIAAYGLCIVFSTPTHSPPLKKADKNGSDDYIILGTILNLASFIEKVNYLKPIPIVTTMSQENCYATPKRVKIKRF